MYRQAHAVENVDWTVLQNICEAEDTGKSAPPVYNDTLFRLAAAGLVQGDNERIARMTPAGRRELGRRTQSAPKPGPRH